ncbi:hypothetical protein, partial [Vulcaniibacterium tengchongense]
ARRRLALRADHDPRAAIAPRAEPQPWAASPAHSTQRFDLPQAWGRVSRARFERCRAGAPCLPTGRTIPEHASL